MSKQRYVDYLLSLPESLRLSKIRDDSVTFFAMAEADQNAVLRSFKSDATRELLDQRALANDLQAQIDSLTSENKKRRKVVRAACTLTAVAAFSLGIGIGDAINAFSNASKSPRVDDPPFFAAAAIDKSLQDFQALAPTIRLRTLEIAYHYIATPHPLQYFRSGPPPCYRMLSTSDLSERGLVQEWPAEMCVVALRWR